MAWILASLVRVAFTTHGLTEHVLKHRKHGKVKLVGTTTSTRVAVLPRPGNEFSNSLRCRILKRLDLVGKEIVIATRLFIGVVPTEDATCSESVLKLQSNALLTVAGPQQELVIHRIGHLRKNIKLPVSELSHLISFVLFHEELVELFPSEFSSIPNLLPQPVEIIVGKSVPIVSLVGSILSRWYLNWLHGGFETTRKVRVNSPNTVTSCHFQGIKQKLFAVIVYGWVGRFPAAL